METITDIVPSGPKGKKSNTKYFVIGALLLIGGYIAYKKFYASKDVEQASEETPTDRGVVAPSYNPDVVSSPAKPFTQETLNVTSSNAGLFSESTPAITTSQNLPSNFVKTAGLGAY
jgi:hypothetical protein